MARYQAFLLFIGRGANRIFTRQLGEGGRVFLFFLIHFIKMAGLDTFLWLFFFFWLFKHNVFSANFFYNYLLVSLTPLSHVSSLSVGCFFPPYYSCWICVMVMRCAERDEADGRDEIWT